MKDHLLGVRRLIGDDAGAANLGTSASRRRHGNDRQDALRVGAGPPVANVLEIPHRPDLPGHKGDDLAGIEPRAATERHDTIVVASFQRGNARRDVGCDRVRLDL